MVVSLKSNKEEMRGRLDSARRDSLIGREKLGRVTLRLKDLLGPVTRVKKKKKKEQRGRLDSARRDSLVSREGLGREVAHERECRVVVVHQLCRA